MSRSHPKLFKEDAFIEWEVRIAKGFQNTRTVLAQHENFSCLVLDEKSKKRKVHVILKQIYPLGRTTNLLSRHYDL